MIGQVGIFEALNDAITITASGIYRNAITRKAKMRRPMRTARGSNYNASTYNASNAPRRFAITRYTAITATGISEIAAASGSSLAMPW